MGCGTSRSMPAESGEEKHSKPVRTSRPSKTIGVGRPVGGATRAADKREAQLEAAEKRAAKAASRGLGTTTRGKELNQSSKKQELIGRIHALYNTLNKEVPIGLNIASVDQLQNHYDSLKSSIV